MISRITGSKVRAFLRGLKFFFGGWTNLKFNNLSSPKILYIWVRTNTVVLRWNGADFSKQVCYFYWVAPLRKPSPSRPIKRQFWGLWGQRMHFFTCWKKNTQPFWLLDEFTKSSPAKTNWKFFFPFRWSSAIFFLSINFQRGHNLYNQVRIWQEDKYFQKKLETNNDVSSIQELFKK